MKKRVLSLFLAVMMLLSVLPASVLAADGEITAAVLKGHPAAYAISVTVDGKADEKDWALSGNLSDGTDFGFLWNEETLYFAAKTTAAVSLKINGAACTPADSASDTVQELAIPFAELGLKVRGGETLNVEIACGDAAFTGVVELDTLVRSHVPACSQHGQSKQTANLGYSIANNEYHMWDRYGDGSATGASGDRVYAIFKGVTPLSAANQAHVVEFDFYADALPEIKPGWFGNYNYANYGFTMVISEAKPEGYCMGIANTADGLAFCVNAASGQTHRSALINKSLKETFHVRMEQYPSNELFIYIDDVLVLQHENAMQLSSANVEMISMNLFAGSPVVEDGSMDIDFTVSNLIAGARKPASPVAPDHPAAYSDAVTVDGSLSELDWAMSGKLSDGTGLGFLWNRENLYLAVDSTEAVSLTIEDETYTPAAANAVIGDAQEIVIPFADLAMTPNGGETLFVEVACGSETYAATVVLEPLDRSLAPTNGQYGIEGNPDNVQYDFTDDVYHMWAKYNPDAAATDSAAANGKGGRVYAIFNNQTPLSYADQSHVVEFDFTSAAMPVTEPAWDGDWYYSYKGGLCMVISKGTNNGFIVGIHNTASGLVFFVNPNSGQSPATALLNKKVGDSFHVRLEQLPNGDLLGYVDDELVLNYAKAGKLVWGGVNQIIMNLWNGNASDGIQLAEDGSGDLDITVSNLIVGAKELAPSLLAGLTFDRIKGANTTETNIKEDLELPAVLSGTMLKNVGITWTSSNPEVIAADGTVTQPEEEDATVTLTAALTEDPTVTKTFTLSVPSSRFMLASTVLADSLSMNFFVYAHDLTDDTSYAKVEFNGETTVIPKEEWITVPGDLGPMYRFTFSGIAAKQMADELTITVYDVNDQQVGPTVTDSVRAYAMRMFGKGLDTMLVDMLNYGAAAQSFFGYNAEDPANGQLSDEQQALATGAVAIADLRESTGSYAGSSLALESRIELNFYFTDLTEDMTATLSWTDHYGKDKSVAAEIEPNGNLFRVAARELAVADAFQTVTCTVTDAAGNVVAEATDSVESYCARMTDLELGEPLMKFADSACKFFHPTTFTNVILHLGADESQLNFTWYNTQDGDGTVTFAPTADMLGRHFPEDAITVAAEPGVSVKEGYFAYLATISGLEPDTSYTYQLTAGDETGMPEAFTTAPDGAFSFAVVGDAQIGRGQIDGLYSEEALKEDYAAWGRTLNQISTDETFAGVRFLLSMGDQINSNYTNNGSAFSYAAHENQFDHFANHEELLRLPMAATYGNHDSYAYSVYPYHFNQPNRDAVAGIDYDDAVSSQVNTTDYYFVYNNILFLVLNNLDITAHQEYTEENKAAMQAHCDFVDRAIAETADQDIKWKIVLYHASPYGSSYHNDYTMKDGVYTRGEQYAFVKLRQYLIPHLYEAGVDLVLSGHDHTYSRTYVIKPGQDESGNYLDEAIITDQSNEITNPDGIVHVTASTSSGSAINIPYFQHSYTAVRAEAKDRQAIRIDVTDNSLTLVNYNLGTRTTDSITEVDRVTIYRTDAE